MNIISVKKIRIKNFKSLHTQKIELQRHSLLPWELVYCQSNFQGHTSHCFLVESNMVHLFSIALEEVGTIPRAGKGFYFKLVTRLYRESIYQA